MTEILSSSAVSYQYQWIRLYLIDQSLHQTITIICNLIVFNSLESKYAIDENPAIIK